MWETIAIILSLGGLEFTLWFLDQRAAKRDHEMQTKQLEILDGILTELAIQNAEDINRVLPPQSEGVQIENSSVGTANRTEIHSVCH